MDRFVLRAQPSATFFRDFRRKRRGTLDRSCYTEVTAPAFDIRSKCPLNRVFHIMHSVPHRVLIATKLINFPREGLPSRDKKVVLALPYHSIIFSLNSSSPRIILDFVTSLLQNHLRTSRSRRVFSAGVKAESPSRGNAFLLVPFSAVRSIAWR